MSGFLSLSASRIMDSVNPQSGRLRFTARLMLHLFLVTAIAPLASSRVKPKLVQPDIDYLSALNAANRFLQAWQSQDHETGLMMVSDSAKLRISEDRLQGFFSPEPGAAYEIGYGKKLRAGRYVFPVTLLEVIPSGETQRIRRRLSQVVVVKSGKKDWDIDRLP